MLIIVVTPVEVSQTDQTKRLADSHKSVKIITKDQQIQRIEVTLEIVTLLQEVPEIEVRKEMCDLLQHNNVVVQ